MNVGESKPFRRAAAQVERWAAFYTRGIDSSSAASRRRELASDLYEHSIWADRIRQVPRVTATVILIRLVLGIPSDLSWRRTQRKHAATTGTAHASFARLNSVLIGGALVGAVVLSAFGTYVSVRTLAWDFAGHLANDGAHEIGVPVFTVLTIFGATLLARRRTRVVGAAWLAAAGSGILLTGLSTLTDMSVTVVGLENSMPADWAQAVGCLAGCVALGYIALAVHWLPRRVAATTRRSGA